MREVDAKGSRSQENYGLRMTLFALLSGRYPRRGLVVESFLRFSRCSRFVLGFFLDKVPAEQ